MNKAEPLFRKMDLQWDLEQLEQLEQLERVRASESKWS
jgi:hypothetical protein